MKDLGAGSLHDAAWGASVEPEDLDSRELGGDVSLRQQSLYDKGAEQRACACLYVRTYMWGKLKRLGLSVGQQKKRLWRPVLGGRGMEMSLAHLVGSRTCVSACR